MTTNADRAAILVRALQARVGGDVSGIYTDDVTAWTPSLTASSLTELLAEFDRREEGFSDIELAVTPLDVGGDYAGAEWQVSMTHSAPLTVADGAVVEPTGLRVTLHGVTVAEFRGDRICSLRQYWDELSLFEQLGLLV